MQNSGASLPGFPGISDLADPDLPAKPEKPDWFYRAPGKNDSYGYGFIDFNGHGLSIVNICSPVKRKAGRRERGKLRIADCGLKK
jgi:hypothetical protein